MSHSSPSHTHAGDNTSSEVLTCMCDRSAILVLNCDLLNIQALHASVVLLLHRHISKALAYVKVPFNRSMRFYQKAEPVVIYSVLKDTKKIDIDVACRKVCPRKESRGDLRTSQYQVYLDPQGHRSSLRSGAPVGWARDGGTTPSAFRRHLRDLNEGR